MGLVRKHKNLGEGFEVDELNPKWYVVEVYQAGAERTKMQAIQATCSSMGCDDLLFAVRCPMIENDQGKKVPEISRYIYVKCIMTGKMQSAISFVPGVRLIGVGKTPAPILASEVKKLKLEDNTRNIVVHVGDIVRAPETAFCNYDLKVIEVQDDFLITEVINDNSIHIPIRLKFTERIEVVEGDSNE